MLVPSSEGSGLADATLPDEFNDIIELGNLDLIQPSGGSSHCVCLRGNPLSNTILPSPPTELPLVSMLNKHPVSVPKKDHQSAAFIGDPQGLREALPTLKTAISGQEPMKNLETPHSLLASGQPLMFADLFAGCGGLSLGLSLAGLNGVFAVERDKMAFSTLSANLIEKRDVPAPQFQWPDWLERKAWGIDEILEQHAHKLSELKGKVHVLAGGPPCQGFSFAGKRLESDPRNQLFEKYVEMVKAIQPAAIVLENVPGMKVAHKVKSWEEDVGLTKLKHHSYYDKLVESLNKVGYQVLGKIVDCSLFGVPQKRPRLIVIGIRKDLAHHLRGGVNRAFELLEEARLNQLQELGLPEIVSASEAISDLEIKHVGTRPCTDPSSRTGFLDLAYKGPRTHYQTLMHQGSDDPMDSVRLAKHKPEISGRFLKIIQDPECVSGGLMSLIQREKYGLKKHRIYLMHEANPAPTITTLPDDVLHYSEPRILTVRESARLQSFPDWFQFRGKFTTGGSRRTKECPRYTQVGNAVPPYLARAIGLAVRSVLAEAKAAASQQTVNEVEQEILAIA
ncbi:DNA cytosine methyltransferase [Pseudomonas syringae]|uniref:DNA cytosine methyltransferase n=1 Tax=Pseudomonas syringae TaxID=317 RepID=UPI0004139CC9|nr:DNA cytosine methyltransferase [Pseudomonas syringae]PBP85915.1 DNA (cytosine-5-)-methyltransferase [Pseudomonas syringae]